MQTLIAPQEEMKVIKDLGLLLVSLVGGLVGKM